MTYDTDDDTHDPFPRHSDYPEGFDDADDEELEEEDSESIDEDDSDEPLDL